MTQRSLEAMAQRLDRLERERRWWKVTGVGSAVVMALVLLLGAAPRKAPDEIRARRVVVVDGEGRERITLGWYFGYGLKIIGKDDKTRISLEDWDNGQTELGLHSQQGSARVKLTVRSDGSPSLSLFDPPLAPRAVLGAIGLENPATGVREERPASSLVLFGRDGPVVWRAP